MYYTLESTTLRFSFDANENTLRLVSHESICLVLSSSVAYGIFIPSYLHVFMSSQPSIPKGSNEVRHFTVFLEISVTTQTVAIRLALAEPRTRTRTLVLIELYVERSRSKLEPQPRADLTSGDLKMMRVYSVVDINRMRGPQPTAPSDTYK